VHSSDIPPWNCSHFENNDRRAAARWSPIDGISPCANRMSSQFRIPSTVIPQFNPLKAFKI
jgi:hypothetical protein